MRQRHAGRAERVDGGDELDQTARRIQRQSVVVGEGSGAAATVIADRTSVRVHGAQRPQRARLLVLASDRRRPTGGEVAGLCSRRRELWAPTRRGHTRRERAERPGPVTGARAIVEGGKATDPAAACLAPRDKDETGPRSADALAAPRLRVVERKASIVYTNVAMQPLLIRLLLTVPANLNKK